MRRFTGSTSVRQTDADGVRDEPRRSGAEQLAALLGGHGSSQEEPLRRIAVQCGKHLPLGSGLHTFGDEAPVEL